MTQGDGALLGVISDTHGLLRPEPPDCPIPLTDQGINSFALVHTSSNISSVNFPVKVFC